MSSGLAGAAALIGVDDTDNISSRGTGFLVQRLVVALEHAGFGTALGATRHQLLVDDAIPYTSHNSSACIAWTGPPSVTTDDLADFCGRFLTTESAPGSDPGLVVAARRRWRQPEVRSALVTFGRQAKAQVLDQATARHVAAASGVHASGHGGDEGGVIGALAAVGLHLSGGDGFFLWMPGIRQLLGHATYAGLRAAVPIDLARDDDGQEPAPEDRIILGDWVRPILSGGQAVLLLRRSGDTTSDWVVAPRVAVRAH